jgi:hypothetical protein
MPPLVGVRAPAPLATASRPQLPVPSLDYLDIIASIHMNLPAVFAGLVEIRIWLGRNAHNALRLKTQIFPENVMLALRVLALHSTFAAKNHDSVA